jgi:tetratricopeptide (TPR) repeat protein
MTGTALRFPSRDAILASALDALERGAFADAAAGCASLIAVCPDDAEALCLGGVAAGAAGDIETAARLLHDAAMYRGRAGHPMLDLIALLRRTGQRSLIEPQLRAALRLAPRDRTLSHSLADTVYEAGRYDDARSILQDMVRRDPADLPARNLLAMTLAATGDTAAAIGQFIAAIKLDPGQPGLWANLGLLLKDDGRFEEAVAAYDTAVRLSPNDARIRVNRVVALLRAGLWAKAWPDFEWRLLTMDNPRPRSRLLPDLASVSGRTVLITHEDGFGDTLHFVRYAPLLAARGARVIAAVPKPLSRIIASVAGVSEVCDVRMAWPDHDFECPFFSLPRVFETAPDTIPPCPGYLRADPDDVAVWKRRLDGLSGLRVGLVWAGQARPDAVGFVLLDGRRSLALSAFAPLTTIPGISFIALQHGVESMQALTPPAGMRLIDPMGGVRDFADTAAIVANLDLVITVDTAMAHLGGGLGRPVFLLDRYDHCWRWLSGRDDSPWYPSMRIFRQPRIGDWDTPMRAVARALADRRIPAAVM